MNNTTTLDVFSSHSNHKEILLWHTKHGYMRRKKINKERYNARNRELDALEQQKICSLQLLNTQGNNF